MSGRHYRVSRTIEASPRTVWDILTDADRYDDWNEAVVSIRGPIELGNTIQLVSTVNPKRTFKLEVVEMDAPKRMVWEDAMPLGLFRCRRTYSIDQVTDDRSEFTMVEEFSGPLAGLITKAIPDLTDSFNTFADSLTAASETRT